MITQKTLLTIRLLHELVYKIEDLDGFAKRYTHTDATDGALSAETAAEAVQSVEQAHSVLDKALLEALEKVAPQFVDTPFSDRLTAIIAGYKDGSSRAKLHASVELSSIDRQADEWLNARHRASLPVQSFVVKSAFGEFIIEETDGNRARVKAAEQHYGASIGELDHNVLRNFAVGEPRQLPAAV